MSIKVMTAIWENKTGNLDAYETSYLLKLADYGPQVFPSIPTLSKKTRISPRKIQYLNEALVKKDYLEVVERTRANGSDTSNAYRLNINKLLTEAGMEPLEHDEMGDPPARHAPPPARHAPPPCTPCTPLKQELKQVLNQDKENKQKKEASRPEVAISVLSVFEYWQKVMNHPRAVLDKKRKRLLEEALKSYSADDLKKAIDGCASDKWYMGENERGTIFDALHIILKDSDKIEGFIRMSNIKIKPTSSKSDYRQAANSGFEQVFREQFSVNEEVLLNAI